MWKLMSEQEARRIVDNWPKTGVTSAERYAKYREAAMVLDGRSEDEIKLALEQEFGPLD